jgi:hypothetical protein
MTIVQEVKKIIPSKLDDKAKAVYNRLKEETNNFDIEFLVVYTDLEKAVEQFVDVVKKKYPDAIRVVRKKEKPTPPPTPEPETDDKEVLEVIRDYRISETQAKRLVQLRRDASESKKESIDKMLDTLKKSEFYNARYTSKQNIDKNRTRDIKKDSNRGSLTAKDELNMTGNRYKRISKAGHKNQYGTTEGGKVYYEYRANRRDIDHKIELAKGGLIGKEVEFLRYGEPMTGWVYEDLGNDRFAVESTKGIHSVDKENIVKVIEPKKGRFFGLFNKGGLVELGDNVNVIAENKSGVVINVISNGKYFTIQFADGTKKVYDKNEIKKIFDEYDEYSLGGGVEKFKYEKGQKYEDQYGEIILLNKYSDDLWEARRFSGMRHVGDVVISEEDLDLIRTKKMAQGDVIKGSEGIEEDNYRISISENDKYIGEYPNPIISITEAKTIFLELATKYKRPQYLISVYKKPTSTAGYKKINVDEWYADSKSFKRGGGVEIPNADKMFHLPFELAVYVPSTTNVSDSISTSEMRKRVKETETYLAETFGGFTSSEKIGGYLSSKSTIVTEKVVPVTAFCSMEDFRKNKNKLINKLSVWAKAWGQEAIGFEFEGDLYYVPQKFKRGGTLKATYIPKDNIAEITTIFGQRIKGKDIIDGAYTKRRDIQNEPKIDRFMFEDEMYEYAKGGWVLYDEDSQEAIRTYKTESEARNNLYEYEGNANIVEKSVWDKTYEPKVDRFMFEDEMYEYKKGGKTPKKPKEPKMIRTIFEEEYFEDFGKGGRVSEDVYYDMLGAVPPLYISELDGVKQSGNTTFAVGEAYDYMNTPNGFKSVYQAFSQKGKFYYNEGLVYFTERGVAKSIKE